MSRLMPLPLTLLIAGLLGLLTGCKPQKAPPSQSADGPVIIALKRDPTTLDPALNNDATAEVLAKIYDGLVAFDEKLTPKAALAEKWTISPDGKTYVFTLRPGVTFHGGQTLDASDVVFSLSRLKDSAVASPFLDWYNMVEKVEARGAGEVVITLNRPFAPFLGLLAMSGAYVLDKDWASKSGRNLNLETNGTGPFSLVEWKKGLEVQLERNNSYFAGSAGVPGLTYRLYTEERAAETDFQQGKLHLMPHTYVSDLSVNRLLALPKGQFGHAQAPGLNVFYLGMNTQKPPFDNPLVRRAMNMAINRKLINDQLYQGRNQLASGPVPPSLPGHSGVAPYAANTKQAAALLKKAGLEKGFDTVLWHKADKAQTELAEVISHELSQVGVKAEIRPLESAAFKEKVIAGEAPLFLMNWFADYADAENFLFPLFHSQNLGGGGNRARLQNPELDEFITQAQTTPDDKTRLGLYEKADAMVHDLAPWVFLWHQPVTVFYQNSLGGVKATPLFSADKGTTYFWKKKT